MAAEEAADRQVEAFEGTVLAEGFEGVLRAGRGETAAGRLERGDADLIEPYQEHKRRYRHLLNDFQKSGHIHYMSFRA